MALQWPQVKPLLELVLMRLLRVGKTAQAATGMQGDMITGLGAGLHLNGLETGNRPARGVGGEHDLEEANFGHRPGGKQRAQNARGALGQKPNLRRPGLLIVGNGSWTVLQHLSSVQAGNAALPLSLQHSQPSRTAAQARDRWPQPVFLRVLMTTVMLSTDLRSLSPKR